MVNVVHRHRKMFYTGGQTYSQLHTQPKSDTRIAFMPIMLCKVQPACKAPKVEMKFYEVCQCLILTAV